MEKYKDLLIVDNNYNNPYTRTTKVEIKPYGYYVTRFNPYVTVTKVKIMVNSNGSAKAIFKVDKNYQAPYQFTEYYNTEGIKCSKKEYENICK